MLVTVMLAVTVRHARGDESAGLEHVIDRHQSVVVKLFGAGAGSLDTYGSGVLVSAEGHVLTVWNHLVSTGFLTAVTSDGRRFAVDIAGTSAEHDVALLKLKADGETFPFVDLNAARDVAVGSSVLAYSNMYRVASGNEPVSVVHGVIAASVPLEARQGRWSFPLKSPVWLIDAITNNSGAAGGLLTDLAGQPVGLLGREIRHTGSTTWVNYAVPLTTLKPVVDTLRSGRRVENTAASGESSAARLSDQELTARFGLTLLPDVLDRTPAWVDAVTADSIAARSGLQRGDLIVLIDDSVVTSVADVQRLLAGFRSGQRITVTVNRNQELVAIELGVP